MMQTLFDAPATRPGIETPADLRAVVFPDWRPSGLSEAEWSEVERAVERGYIIGTGQRMAVVLAFKARCRMAGRSCVVGHVGARQASIEVDGRIGWKGPTGELEQAARRLADLAGQAAH